MGGSGGGLNNWHRQKRKRELQKNKEQRIAARDAKVKETKTVASVRDEIRNLERQHKDAEIRPHNIQSKIDRLKKELKIVQQEKNSNQSIKSSQAANFPKGSSAASTWKPLQNPSLSVYYDAVLNPYGEPPPGKPSLYHTPNGGTTTDLCQAGLPGQPPLKPSYVENPPKLSSDNKNRRTSKGSNHESNGQTPNVSQNLAISDKERMIRTGSKQKRASDSLLSVNRPKRYGRQNLAADIWADDDDIDFQDRQTATQQRLENLAECQTERTSTEEQWQYRDQAGIVQGPFPLFQMKEWIVAGFFLPSQLVRRSPSGAWTSLENTSLHRGSVVKKKPVPQTCTEMRRPLTVQDRIAALRAEHVLNSVDEDQSNVKEETLTVNHEDKPSVNRDFNSSSVEEALAPPFSRYVDCNEERKDSGGAVSGHTTEDDAGRSQGGPYVQPRSENPSDGPNAPNEVLEDMYSVPYPVEGFCVYENDDRDQYPLHEGDMANVPYPVDEPYPTHEGDMADVPYPVDEPSDVNPDMENAPYLVDHEHTNVDDGHCPVVDTYPIMEDFSGGVDHGEEDSPKDRGKKARLDKDVLSLLPAHLRKKRETKAP